MAAQEYFQGHIPGAPHNPPPPPQQAPPTQPIRIQSSGPQFPLPYPLFDGPPPPYSPGGVNGADQRPHSQPPPQQRFSQNLGPGQQHPEYRPSTLSQSYRPQGPAQSQSSYGYPPEKLYPQTQQYGLPRPGSQSGPPQAYDAQRQQYPPSPQGAWPQQTRPYSPAPAVQPPNLHPPRRKNSAASTEYPPSVYRPDPRDTKPSHKPQRSRSRSRSRSRERRRHGERGTERNSGGKPKSSVNTFLGASGGALIGDAIFPGLGVLGGALLGGLGGHEYGKKDKKGRSTGRDDRERDRGYNGERDRDGRRRRYSDEEDGRRGRR
nr:hypothetical protein B0A51_08262 [Rachicladosporium sp. CCFEE 5018]